MKDSVWYEYIIVIDELTTPTPESATGTTVPASGTVGAASGTAGAASGATTVSVPLTAEEKEEAQALETKITEILASTASPSLKKFIKNMEIPFADEVEVVLPGVNKDYNADEQTFQEI